MFKSHRISASVLAALILVVAVGCSKDKGKEPAMTGELTASDSILRYVPADTPYAFVSGAPLPDDLLDKIEPKTDEMLQSYQVVFREVARGEIAKNDSDMDATEIAKATALTEELVSLISIKSMRNAGITRESRFVVFGNGLLPVIRIEVDNAASFEAAIARIEEAADAEMDTAEIDGKPYRYIEDDESRVIVALLDGNAVFTMAPAAFGEDELKVLLGLELPAENIAESGKLQQVATEYGFTEHFLGFIDTMQLASRFIDEPEGLDAALLDASDDEPLSAVCKQELRETAAVVPRMVFGYEEMSAEAMNGAFIVDVRDDIAAEMKTLTAMVPGLGQDPGGLLSFGLSFNLQAIRGFMEARLDALEADPYECEHFAEIQDGVPGGRAALAQPMPPFVNGLRGMNVVIESASDLDFSSGAPPRDVDASVLLAMDDAAAMVGMGAMFSPELAALNLQPDSVPVELDMPQVQMVAETAYAAMSEGALAVAVGDDAETRVTDALESDSADPPPFMSFAMDASTYYGLLAEDMMQSGGDDTLSDESRAAMRDAMLAVGEIYDRMQFDVRFTDRGVEIGSRATLLD